MVPLLLSMLALSRASRAAIPPAHASERLFVYFRERGRQWIPAEGVYRNEVPHTQEEISRLSGGELCALWLPSGRRAVLPRQAGGPRFFGDPRSVLVSPTGGYVAIIARQSSDPHLLVQDVVRGGRKDVADFTSDLGLVPVFHIGLNWIGPERLLVNNDGLSTLARGSDGWHYLSEWPSSASIRSRNVPLDAIEDALNRREPERSHEVIGLSPDGRLVAAYASVPAAPEHPLPPMRGRRALFAYDARTGRRIIGGPVWEDKGGVPPETLRYAGWVGERLAYVGPSRKDPKTPSLTLRDAKEAREYPLDGLVGRLWSLQGGPGVASRPY